MGSMFSLCRSEAENYVNDAFTERVVAALQCKKYVTSLYGLYCLPDVPREAIITRCADQSRKNSRPDARKLFWLPPFKAWDMSTIGNLSLALLWHIYRSLPQEILTDEKIIYKLGKISVTLPSLTNGLHKVGGNYHHDIERHTTISNNAFPSEKKSSVSSIFSACEQISELAETFHRLSEHIGAAGDFDSLVVPVIDIDLCLPEQAVSLLFAIRTFICSEAITVVVCSDEALLKKYLISLYDNSLTEKQSKKTLESLFDDWATLPLPDGEKMAQSLDINLNTEEKRNLFRCIEESGLLTTLPDPHLIHNVFHRFNLFIIRSLDAFSKEEYCCLLLLFLFRIAHKELYETCTRQPDLVQQIVSLRKGVPDTPVASSKSTSRREKGHRVTFSLNHKSDTSKTETTDALSTLFSDAERKLLHAAFSAIPKEVSEEYIAEWMIALQPFA